MAREFFADRTYDDSGNLTSRKQAGLGSARCRRGGQRVLRTLHDRALTTVSGKRIAVEIDTICVHGDEPSAVAMARTIRGKLEAAGITVAPFARRRS